MKTTELIKILEFLVEKHGDLEIFFAREWIDAPVDGVEYRMQIHDAVGEYAISSKEGFLIS